MTEHTKPQDMSARLLATENINIVRSNVRTASFDIKGRTLTLPRWKEMTPEIEEMLILHEVGHALFTDYEQYRVVFEELKKVRDYANIIEDVRIERFMKDRYPGCRKNFSVGYRQLNERNFFEIKGIDFSTLLLIDRINLYYKIGYNCGVKFTPEEMTFVSRADRCRSVEEVVALSLEIFEFSKKEREEQKQKFLASQDEEGSSGDYEEDYDDYSDDDTTGEQFNDSDEDDEELEDNEYYNSTQRSGESNETEVNEKELESKTNKSFSSRLEQLSDENLVIEYFVPEFYEHYDDTIIDFKTVINDFKNSESLDGSFEFRKAEIDSFKLSSNRVVNFLVKEFEMRKSATNYKRTKIAKLGQLDSKKLYAFKMKDDLFKQIMQVQDGKRHGMVFLLDWSGSMSECIRQTIEQVINLSMFCRRADIPFQVFAFSDGCGPDGFSSYAAKVPTKFVENGIGSGRKFNLIELLSHKMTSSEFNFVYQRLLCRPYNLVKKYRLNGTPLNQSLVFMIDYIGKFIKQNQSEKTSFILLTDGDGSALSGYQSQLKNGRSWSTTGHVNKKCYLTDPITKKEYDLSNDSIEQTALLLQVIKDRYNTTNIRFYIMPPYSRSVREYLRQNTPKDAAISNYAQTAEIVDGILKQMRKNDCAVMTNVEGVDEMYLVSANAKIEDDISIKADSTMNSKQLAKNFTQVMSRNKTSRVLLDKFIGQVA